VIEQAFLTGATGFIGMHLARALRARAIPVRALVRPRGHGDTQLQTLKALGVELVVADMADAQALRAGARDASHVFHLAGKLFGSGVAEAVYQRLHVDGTRRLLEVCACSSSLRAIVHCSTTGVLGPTGPHPRAEDAPLRPGNSYERTKAAAEQLALDAAARHGLPLAVARPALVYGPGDLHLLGWFRAIQRGLYRVVGAGTSLLHPIYIDDLVDGLIRCATNPAAIGRVYHLVGHAALPIRDLASAIAGALGRELPRGALPFGPTLALATLLEHLPGMPSARLPLTGSRILFMSQSRTYCGCRARTELQFIPRIDLDDGLRRTVAWYRSEGLL
jgi:nucleoside-diphosphate-sugar epimerase